MIFDVLTPPPNPPLPPTYSNSPDGLLTLSLADLRLLVTLCNDFAERDASDGTLELVGAPGALLHNLLRLALLVLAAVQHSPVDVPGVALHGMGTLTFLAQEVEHLTKDILMEFLVLGCWTLLLYGITDTGGGKKERERFPKPSH